MAFIVGALILLLAFAVPGRVQPVHVVQSGDTLYQIAQEHGIRWQDLAEYNRIENPEALWVGTRLRIPGHREGLNYEAEEQLLLARLIHAEARGESLEGQIAVGAVVVNRVRSSSFPNTIEEVIWETGQFTPVKLGLLPEVPQPSSQEAAIRALQGEDPTGGALFFYNPRTTRNHEWWSTRSVIRRIGNHNFAI